MSNDVRLYQDSVILQANGTVEINQICPMPMLDFIPIYVDKSLVYRCDTGSAVETLGTLISKNMLSEHGLVFGFSDFEDDHREIYQIPEIREWIQKLMTSMPYLFYYLNEIKGNMQFIFFCLVSIQTEIWNSRINKRWNVTDNPEMLIKNIIGAAAEHSRNIGDSVEKQSHIEWYILNVLCKPS